MRFLPVILAVLLATSGCSSGDNSRPVPEDSLNDAAGEVTIEADAYDRDSKDSELETSSGPPDALPDAETEDIEPALEPALHLNILRGGDSVQFPPVMVEAIVTDARGQLVSPVVELTAVQPDGFFTPEVEPVLSGRAGTWWQVSAQRSGEVTITGTAEVDGQTVKGSETIVFLPFVAQGWGVPTAVSELNTRGHEDSMSISPDGQTLFFSYTPLENCNIMPAGYGDPVDKPECVTPWGPVGTPERSCALGLTAGAEGTVLPGLFGNSDVWPWVKSMYCTYVSRRQQDGRFGTPTFVSFNDDGIILEVSPGSGPENPEAGKPYNLFFGYPDWLNVDPDHDGSIFAVASVVEGKNTLLGSPITTPGSPPDDLGVQTLSGPINDVREGSATVGEFRVCDDPTLGTRAVYFERRETAETTLDIVRSPLTGTYPVGDWGEAMALPAPINSDTHDESFPWLVELSHDGVTQPHLYFSRGKQDFSEPSHILESRYGDGEWSQPVPILESAPGSGQGEILLVVTPCVSEGPQGVEMFFHYIVAHPDRLDFQIGVLRRME